MSKYVYTFKVERPGDIDYERICRECEEDGHDAVVVTVRGGEKATVMLAKTFIDFGRRLGGGVVAGHELGDTMWVVHPVTDRRACWWYMRHIPVTDVGKVIQEIRAIKERVPLFKVNVHCIEAKAQPERSDLPRYEKRAEPAVKWVRLSDLKIGDLFRIDRDGPVRAVSDVYPFGKGIRYVRIGAKSSGLMNDMDVIPVTATFTNETE